MEDIDKEGNNDAKSGLVIGEWQIVCALIIVAITAAYMLLQRSFTYWKERGFPELPGRPLLIFGHTFNLIAGQKGFWEVYDDLYKASGDEPFIGFFQGTRPLLMVKDPELMKRMLVKDFHAFADRALVLDEEIDPINSKGLANLKGHRWKEMRARLSPAFASGRMKAMFPIMQTCAEELVASLSKKVQENKGEAVFEVKELVACYSTDVIATCVFGLHCDALQNPEASEFRRMGKKTLETSLKRTVMLAIFLIFPRALKWLGMKFTDDETTIFFLKLVKDMVDEREKAIKREEVAGSSEKKRFGDYIYQLVLLKQGGLQAGGGLKEEEEHYDGELQQSEKYDQHKSLGIDDAEPSWANISLEDLTAQVMQFFSAGFETTSVLLSFTLFELTSTERGRLIQQNLRDEIDRVMGEDEGMITYEGVKRMLLLDRVLNGIDDAEPSWANISLEDLTAQVMQFFSAGFETTSVLLSFTLFELTSTERGRLIQQNLRDEIDRVMGEDEGMITYEGVKRMLLLDRVLNEALRLHPPAGFLNRLTLQTYKIPGTNLTLDKGAEVVFPLQAMQYDERCFKNATIFDPDRFLPERKNEWNSFHFLPFGIGPRACIGRRFAQMQARLGLATLLSKFQFELCFDKTRVPMVYNKRAFLLSPQDGVWLKATLR